MNFDATFDKDDFNMQKNMTGAQLDAPVMAEVKDQGFSVKYPSNLDDMNLTEEKKIAADGK